MKHIDKLNEWQEVSVDRVFSEVAELDAPNMEKFLKKLSLYFERAAAAEILSNMDAAGIAKDLRAAHNKVKKRTSN